MFDRKKRWLSLAASCALVALALVVAGAQEEIPPPQH